MQQHNIIWKLVLCTGFAITAWLVAYQKIEQWEFFILTLVIIGIVHSVVLKKSGEEILFFYLSRVVYLPGAVLLLMHPPYPITRPTWWIGNQLIHFVALVTAYIASHMLFQTKTEKSINEKKLPRQDGDHSQKNKNDVRNILMLLMATFVLTGAMYPSVQDIGAYADMMLHRDIIETGQILKQSQIQIDQIGYLVAHGLKETLGIQSDALLWIMQWLLKFGSAIGVYVLCKRWFSESQAFLGSVIMLLAPTNVLDTTQAFRASLGLLYLPFFLSFLTKNESSWKNAILTTVLFIATTLTDLWFSGYLILFIILWILAASLANQTSKTEEVLAGVIGIISGCILFSRYVNTHRLIDAQAAIFRSFENPSSMFPLLAFILIAIFIGSISWISKKTSTTSSHVKNVGLAMFFIIFLITYNSITPLTIITSWAIYYYLSKASPLATWKKADLIFLLLLMLGIAPSLFRYSGIIIGDIGVGYLTPLAFAYFFLKGINQWITNTDPTQSRLILITFLAIITVSMYYLFSYISRFLFNTPLHFKLFFNRALLIALLLSVPIFLKTLPANKTKKYE